MGYRITAIIGLMFLTGCAAPWNLARGTISGARGALDTIAEQDELPQDELARPLEIIRSGLAAGDLAVDIWEEEGERPSGWQKWIGRIPEATSAVINIIKSCGVNMPPAVNVAMIALHMLVSLAGGT